MTRNQSSDIIGWVVNTMLGSFGGTTISVFDELAPGARVQGLVASGPAEIVQVNRFGADVLSVVFRAEGRIGERLVYRGEEIGLEVLQLNRAFAFNADGELLRLASEAYRIRLAHLFDPFLAISGSCPSTWWN